MAKWTVTVELRSAESSLGEIYAQPCRTTRGAIAAIERLTKCMMAPASLSGTRLSLQAIDRQGRRFNKAALQQLFSRTRVRAITD